MPINTPAQIIVPSLIQAFSGIRFSFSFLQDSTDNFFASSGRRQSITLLKMCRYDALFYIIFQITGSAIAVYIIAALLGNVVTSAPVNYAVTIPGKFGTLPAAVAEYIIAVITMSIVLFTSENKRLEKYTRIFAACLVCTWVIFAGPVSGFGMNPARSFASAFPAHIYTAFWIYMIIPFAGMLTAAEFFLFVQGAKQRKQNKMAI